MRGPSRSANKLGFYNLNHIYLIYNKAKTWSNSEANTVTIFFYLPIQSKLRFGPWAYDASNSLHA